MHIYDLNLKKSDLVELLRVATKDQLFQHNGLLFEQTDGVAMRSPLGPLLALAPDSCVLLNVMVLCLPFIEGTSMIR